MANLSYYNKIKKYYINLDQRPDRREIIEQQVGNDFERVAACFGKGLTEAEVAELFDLEKSFQEYKVNLTRGQISCTISHFQIYQKVAQDASIADDDFVFISEDDNLFVPEFKTKLDQIIKFISQPKFNSLEILIGRFFEFSEFVDFSAEAASFNPKTREYNLTHPSKAPLIPEGLFVCHFQSLDKDNQHFSFEYQGVAPSQHPDLYSNKQTIMAANFFTPWSSACYLMRKSTIKRIVATYKKPFWITDDFKSIIPTQHIFLASPTIARDYEAVAQSDIQDQTAYNNSQETVVLTKEDLKSNTTRRKKPWVYGCLYHNLAPVRWFGKLAESFLGLNVTRGK